VKKWGRCTGIAGLRIGWYADWGVIPVVDSHVPELAGQAALVPCAFVDGMPAGIKIIGPRLADERVIRAAKTLSEEMPWADRHPALADSAQA